MCSVDKWSCKSHLAHFTLKSSNMDVFATICLKIREVFFYCLYWGSREKTSTHIYTECVCIKLYSFFIICTSHSLLTLHKRTYWDGLMPQLDLYFYICFTYDYVVTCFQFTITIRLHYRVRCNPKVIQIELTVNDIHEVQRAPVLWL